MVIDDEEQPFGVTKGYDIQWPVNASSELTRSLALLGFNEKNGMINLAIAKYREDLMNDGEEKISRAVLMDRVPEDVWDVLGNFDFVNITYRQDDFLYTFSVFDLIYIYPKIHHYYSDKYVLYDNSKQKIIELTDLLDTNQLKPILYRAIMDFDINAELKDCMFDSVFMPETPLTCNFYIDSDLNTINLVYEPYEIAPFICGIMTLKLPVNWLKKRLTLTPYCLKLFGLR